MKVALFDVDGTILNSMGAWENVGRIYLKTKGIEASKNLNNILYPLTIMQSASYLKNQYHLDDSIQEIMEAFHQDLDDYYAYEVDLKDGIVDIFEALARDDYHLYIATASTKEFIAKSFKRLDIERFFEGVFTTDLLNTSKSEPLFYSKIAQRLEISKSDIVVFEDNPMAALAAQQAGMKVVGIYDKHTRGNLENCVNTYVNNWHELMVE